MFADCVLGRPSPSSGSLSVPLGPMPVYVVLPRTSYVNCPGSEKQVPTWYHGFGPVFLANLGNGNAGSICR